MDDIHLSETQYRYTPDAGTHNAEQKVFCGVCGSECEVKTGCVGPRGFAQAMAYHMGEIGGVKASPYDSYTCPHHEAVWHKKVVELREWAKQCPVQTLSAIARQEALDKLLEHGFDEGP